MGEKKFHGNSHDLVETKLSIFPEEKKKFEEIRAVIEEEFTDNSWLELIVGKKLLDNGELCKALKIYDFIEKRDLIDKKSNLKSTLYHMLGQLYWQYYVSEKESCKNGMLKNINADKPDISKCDHLKKVREYYEDSLKASENDADDSSTTRGNLSVVLIELSLNDEDVKAQSKYIEDASEHLERIIKENKDTFNTHYDLARAFCRQYKISPTSPEKEDISPKVRKSLLESVDKLQNGKQRSSLVKFMKNDDILVDCPDWEKLHKELLDEINSQLCLNT